jgi:orotate phosphoribosyltransferase-like protein
LQPQIARDLEDHIARIKQPDAQAERGFRHTNIARELKVRKADIGTVQVGEHIADEQERQQPPRDFAVNRARLGQFDNIPFE